MAEFIHDTESPMRGPILIDRNQIEALDSVLEAEFRRFEADRLEVLERDIANAFALERAKAWNKNESDISLKDRITKELTSRSARQSERTCMITLKNGTVARVPDFATALRDPDLDDKEATGFSAAIESGHRECSITVENGWSDSGKLTVKAMPRGDEMAQQAFIALKNWQRSVRPPKWQTIWTSIAGLGMQWIVWIAITFIPLVHLSKRFESEPKKVWRTEAASILADGLQPAEHTRALEIILMSSVGYDTIPREFVIPSWLKLLFWGGLFYCIAIGIRPSVALGIGAGDEKVLKWRRYSTFIMITTPSFIFLTFMWPRIEDWIRGLF